MHPRKLVPRLLGVLLPLILPCAASAAVESLSLAPAADTFIRADQPAVANGANALLLVGDTGAPDGAMRALLSFDLAAALPPDAVVRGASLRLLVEGADKESGDADETLQLLPLAENFTAAATWRKRNSAKDWTAPGGPVASAEPFASAVANPARARPGQALVLEGEKLASAVASARAGRLDLLVKLVREDSARSVFRLGSARSRPPSLVIEYDLPGRPAGVVPVPGHPGRPLSANYRLVAGGRPVEVRAERFGFDVAMLQLPPGGAPVEITLSADSASVSLKPDRHGIALARDGRALSFTLVRPLNLVLQADGLPPLAIIATPLDSAPPRRDDPAVVYFPPGVTDAGVIRPQSGQTLYFAPGALVKGRIEAKNVSDVTIRGRGILETTGYSKREDKTHGVLFENSRRIRMEGVGIRAFHTWWQTLFLNSRDIELAHLNLFGIGVNTDGVDIDGVRDFLVRDTFIRAEDDGLGWHSLDAQANGEAITERARATDIVIWNTTAGNGIRIGASMETQLWRDILIERTDILMHKEHGIYSDYSDWAWTRDLVFRDIVIEKPATPISFLVARTRYSNATGFLDERGHVERLVFDNVRMNGGRISLAGHDADHRIDQVWFNDCVNAGRPVASLDDIVVNAHVTGVRFNTPVPPRPAPPAGRLEAEELESSTNARPQITYADAALSGGKARLLRGSAAGDHVEYLLEKLPPGPGRLSAALRRTPASARVEIAVDGRKIGDETDLYSKKHDTVVLDLGSVVVPPDGAVRVRLDVAGSSPASAGLEIHADHFDLAPAKR